MRLLDVILSLDDLDEASTIYLQEPWTKESNAVVAPEPNDGGLPPEVKTLGLNYFIEVSIAREFLEDWAETLATPPSDNERCERLIQYSMNDA